MALFVLRSPRFVMGCITSMGMPALITRALVFRNDWNSLSGDRVDAKDIAVVKWCGVKLPLLVMLMSPIVMLWLYYHKLEQLHDYERYIIGVNEIIGFTMSVCGDLLWEWSVRTMGKQYTGNIEILDDHKLIDYGPYSIVRHPAYFSYLLWIVGILVYNMGNPIYFPFGLLMIIGLPLRINAEEKKLRTHFGTNQHDKFCRKVKYKYVPFVW